MQHIMCKVYDVDSLCDIERDIYEAIDEASITPEHGSFKIDIVYDDERETMEDWEE